LGLVSYPPSIGTVLHESVPVHFNHSNIGEVMSEYKKGNTKLFNIRVPEYLHGQFKEVAKEEGVSMANLLIGFMERVVNGEEEAIAKSKQNADFDPLADIRTQYRKGDDF
jgi:hypothetical protein